MTRPITPRALALQGVGYSPAQTALQGLWPNPFARAPMGPGFRARHVQGMRPVMAVTVRAPSPQAMHPTQPHTSRPGQPHTTRTRP